MQHARRLINCLQIRPFLLRCLQDTVGSLVFKPGQWVDFHAPGVQHVGGYSICSTPQDLQRSGTFELCVKASRHPCAQWVHQQAAPGDQVRLDVMVLKAPPGTVQPAVGAE
jgi:ferredoxin-NADP reductase